MPLDYEMGILTVIHIPQNTYRLPSCTDYPQDTTQSSESQNGSWMLGKYIYNKQYIFQPNHLTCPNFDTDEDVRSQSPV